ncbi:hypothetical protein N7467_011487 [Penicillium canescens]|nr:hypothetical protein N7467_011487 [Penicillium canescens]
MAILNAGSGVGRVVSGILADRLGRFNVLIISTVLSLLTMLIFWFPAGGNVSLLYMFAATFGFTSGSVLSLEPTCIGQLCEAEQYGSYFGMIYVPVSFITLLCVPIGTTILFSLGAYGFVSVFSFCLFASALSFVMARRAVLHQQWGWRTKI